MSDRHRFLNRVSAASSLYSLLQRIAIRWIRIGYSPKSFVYILISLGPGIPALPTVPQAPSVKQGCRAPIPSKGKQRFGAVSYAKRSIELQSAVTPSSPPFYPGFPRPQNDVSTDKFPTSPQPPYPEKEMRCWESWAREVWDELRPSLTPGLRSGSSPPQL